MPAIATQLEARLSSMLEHCLKPEFRNAARQLGEQYSWNSHFHRLEGVLNEVCHGLGRHPCILILFTIAPGDVRSGSILVMPIPQCMALLKNPDGLFDFPGCEVIKDQRKVKVARVVLDLGGAQAVYLCQTL